MRLYKVTLEGGGYDTFDGAVIACESKQKLEELIEQGYFDDAYDDEHIEHRDRFRVDSKVLSIEGIGYTEMTSDKEAIVILGSFNAG